LDEYDPSGFWPESRVFSIASCPRDREKLRIIYSVKGVYTSRMERELSTGRMVWIKLPYGEFVVDAGADAVLFAGGTGITAFQAFIEELTPQHPHQVLLLYGARCPELLLGRNAIESKAQSVQTFHPFFFAESIRPTPNPSRDGRQTLETQPQPVSTSPAHPFMPRPSAEEATAFPSLEGSGVGQIFPSLACSAEALVRRRKGSGVGHSSPCLQGPETGILPGRLSLDILTDCAGSESAIYYLAGPPAMISALTLGLGQRGIPAGRIRIDAWE